MYTTLKIERNKSVITVWLHRPEVKNAFNSLMVSELSRVFTELSNDDSVQVLILRGTGDIFCSGADLNWMRKVSEQGYSQNLNESRELAQCFHKLYLMPKPVVTVAQGAVKGGGNGLLAASDIVIAVSPTQFAFTEVKLGVVPAVISPYIIQKIGFALASELMLTARNFDEEEAFDIRLINKITSVENLENVLNKYINLLLSNSSQAQAKTKELLRKLPGQKIDATTLEHTAETIAHARISRDGQEGMAAFLEKRKPRW